MRSSVSAWPWTLRAGSSTDRPIMHAVRNIRGNVSRVRFIFLCFMPSNFKDRSSAGLLPFAAEADAAETSGGIEAGPLVVERGIGRCTTARQAIAASCEAGEECLRKSREEPRILTTPMRQALCPSAAPRLWRSNGWSRAPYPLERTFHMRGVKRGFAVMDKNLQRAIASKGGKAAHEQGRAHEWSSAEARIAGRKGGHSRHQRNDKTRKHAEGRRRTNGSFGNGSNGN
jgi:uncharacterized protein